MKDLHPFFARADPLLQVFLEQNQRGHRRQNSSIQFQVLDIIALLQRALAVRTSGVFQPA